MKTTKRKENEKTFQLKANVSSLQALEEKYQLMANQMVTDHLRHNSVFKVREMTVVGDISYRTYHMRCILYGTYDMSHI